jgi:HlyD family secretion protein
MRNRLPLFRTVSIASVALILATVLVLFVARIDRVVVASGRLAGGSRSVRTPVAGRVVALAVEQGATIEPGQVLARLDTEALEMERESARARVRGLEERRDGVAHETERLRTETHPAARARVERAVEQARLKLEAAEKRATRLRTLGGEGLVTQLEIEEVELVRELAEVDLDEARAEPERLASTQRGELDSLRSELAALDAELAAVRPALAELDSRVASSVITADVRGVVLGTDLHELVGRLLPEGGELFRVAVATADRFEGVVRDAGRTRARTGLPVKIRLDGYPWLIHGTVTGHVAFVSERRDESGGFPTTISLDEAPSPGPLYEGMGGEARIVIEEKVSVGRLLLERLVEPGGS